MKTSGSEEFVRRGRGFLQRFFAVRFFKTIIEDPMASLLTLYIVLR